MNYPGGKSTTFASFHERRLAILEFSAKVPSRAIINGFGADVVARVTSGRVYKGPTRASQARA
jgi:hypothetical protein